MDITINDEYQLDLEEIKNLMKLATRTRVKNLLSEELNKINNEQSSKTTKPLDIKIEPISTVASTAAKYYKDITNYAWDQSDKFTKVYITMNGVHKISKESVLSEFKEKSFMIKVENIEGKNFKCHVAYLYSSIVPSDSYFKIKTDTVLVMLKKKEFKTWAYITEKEDSKKKNPKFDEKKDPNESLIDLMKKMYDEGDDEMKKTITKSFAESRNKNPNMDI